MKREKYEELVASVEREYTECIGTNQVPLKWCGLYWTINSEGNLEHTNECQTAICKEINLWTYWQGRNFFNQDKIREIKYLVVGQDWGNPFNLEDPIMKNIIDINNGKEGVHYFSNVDKKQICDTDANLITLFRELGYKEDRQIDKREFDELFFTNFCLGYRTGNQSGGMTGKQMMSNNNEKYFLKLCELLRPKNIICLGRDTFESVCMSLGANVPEMKDGYNAYLDIKKKKKDEKPYEEANYGDNEKGEIIKSRIYGMSHCGNLGLYNRKPEKMTREKRMELQISDWKRILENSSD